MIARNQGNCESETDSAVCSTNEQALHELKSLKTYNRKRKHNVGKSERIASGVAGAALVAWGIKRRGISGALLGLAGAALIDRGVRGRCVLYKALGVSTADPKHVAEKLDNRIGKETDERDKRPVRDRVQQASEESFPASDPPSFTGAKA